MFVNCIRHVTHNITADVMFTYHVFAHAVLHNTASCFKFRRKFNKKLL